MAPDQHRCANGEADVRRAGAPSCGCLGHDATPVSAVPLPAPVVRAFAAAAAAADPVERFPFFVTEPDAIPQRHPDALEPTGFELDVAGLRPGPELAALLTVVDPDLASDWMLVELTDAAVRLTSWAQAVAARFAGALATRGSMGADDLRVVGGPDPDQVAGTELSMRMSWTRASGSALARRGRAFDGALAATGAALARGEIDAVRADAVVRRLADVPVPVALDVQDAVLPHAPHRTAPQLRADLERALVETDPDEAGERHARAHATRRVERPTVLPDGMSCLRAVLPAVEAVRVHTVLDAAARAARTAGDPRTLDQLRADGLVDLVLHDMCGAVADEPVAPPSSRAPAVAGVGATALAPAGAGVGATALAPAGAGVGATAPGAVVLDGAMPGDTVRRGTTVMVPTPGSRRGVSGAGASAAVGWGGDDVLSGGSLTGSCRARRRPDTLVRVSVSLPTLLGLDDRAADLDGYGPVHPVTARALAAGGVLQRLVTDPLSGTLLDLGRTRYRPTAALADHVRARDRACVRPGCTVPAQSCELDHTRDFGQRPRDGGARGGTSHDNLACLCSTDHRLKSGAGFRLRQRAPGQFQWVTPTGHVYDVGSSAPDPLPSCPPTSASRAVTETSAGSSRGSAVEAARLRGSAVQAPTSRGSTSEPESPARVDPTTAGAGTPHGQQRPPDVRPEGPRPVDDVPPF